MALNSNQVKEKDLLLLLMVTYPELKKQFYFVL